MAYTFDDVAKMVAGEFRKTMDEEGFETFAEMKKCRGWNARDVKNKTAEIIDDLARNERETGTGMFGDFWMADDRTKVWVQTFSINWGEFKKLVFANI